MKMNRYIAEDLKALPLSTWTKIRTPSPPVNQADTDPRQARDACEATRKVKGVPAPKYAAGAHEVTVEVEEVPNTMTAKNAQMK